MSSRTFETWRPATRKDARCGLHVWITAALLAAASTAALADPPELSSWLLNTTGATGYAGLPANAQQVNG